MLEPIDFAGLYQQQLAQANAQNEAAADSDDDIVVN
jgi:preprotein translocase subunit SecB